MSKKLKTVIVTDPEAIEFLTLYRAQPSERKAAMLRYAEQCNAGMSPYLASVQFAVAMGYDRAGAKRWARVMWDGRLA